MASKTTIAMDKLARALGDEAEGCEIDQLAEKVVAQLKKAREGKARAEDALDIANRRIEELESRETSKLG